MPADLTRFDFHVMQFMESEHVEAMSAEEVGAYLLLLCKSWLIGKDCTLPTDPQTLARYARVPTLSKLILDRFPVTETEWGPRCRNNRLYSEWLTAVKRSEDGKRASESRWNPSHATVIRLHNNRNTTVIPSKYDPNTGAAGVVLPKPSQAKPIQTNPNQEPCDFHHISVRYRAVFGCGHSKQERFKALYRDVCAKFGEDAVLEAFDEWGAANVWRKESLKNNGLRFFLSDVSGIIEEKADSDAFVAKKTAPENDPQEVQAQIAVVQDDYRKQVQIKLDEIQKEKEDLATLSPNEF